MRPAATLLALLVPALAAGSTAQWGSGAPLPLARGEVTAAVAGGQIFVVGGFTDDGRNSARVDAYSPARDTGGRCPICRSRSTTR